MQYADVFSSALTLTPPTGREFIPILGQFQALLPSWLFGHIGAPVFCFLFGFNTSVRFLTAPKPT